MGLENNYLHVYATDFNKRILLQTPRMKKLLLLSLSLLVFTNCSSESEENPDTEERLVNIRLSNTSDFDFANIIVDTSNGNVSYEDLNSGAISAYQTFDLAYRYAYVKVEVDGEIFEIFPTDYVGETPLSGGNYTYRLSLTEAQRAANEIGLEFVQD